MEFYIVLSIATLAIAALSVAVWRKTRQIAFLVGFAFLYYWSLYGGWLVTNRAHGADRTYRFEYLYYKLFPVYLDQDYLWTLILYTLFIATIQITVLAVASRPLAPRDAPGARICVSHGSLLAIAATLTAGAYTIAWDAVVGSSGTGASGYGALASGAGAMPLFTVYQIFHQAAVTLTMMGVVVLFSGRDALYVVGRPGSAALGYALMLPAIVGLNFALGNRSMLAFASAGSGLFYMVNTRRPNKVLIASGVLMAAWALVLLGVIRGAGGQRELASQDLFGKVRYVISEAWAQDSESFAAHSSMYGTLQKHVPITYGTSVVGLAMSVIPGIIRPQVVPTAYEHYAIHVGASRDQGFTIHHATGWYLNFGVSGVIAGAILFGWLWGRLFNAFLAVGQARGHFARVFATMAFWTFTAYVPILIRGGPEIYKGAVTESLLIPASLLFAASIRVVKHANRLRFAPISLAELGDPLPERRSHAAGAAW